MKTSIEKAHGFFTHQWKRRKYWYPAFSPLTTMSSTLQIQILILNPLPHMPILGSSNSAANRDMMSKI